MSADLIIDKSSDKIVNINSSIEIPPLWALNDISVKFCNQWEVIDNEELNMRPWQTKDICIVFFNTATTGKDTKILAQFSEGILQSNGVPNCSNEYSSWAFFELIKKYKSWDFNIVLAPWQKAIRHIKVAVPKTMTWDKDMYGCLVYQLDIKKPDAYSWIFYIVNAKASYIHLQIWWALYNKAGIDTIKFFWQDHKMTILSVLAGILGILLIYYSTLAFKDTKKHKK